jgi:5-methyltetrahydropteroyltriglutamate--homocysteine methyltransferase
LLHTPYDLDLEKDESVLTPTIKNWMAFAKQKLKEVRTLADLTKPQLFSSLASILTENQQAIESRKSSTLIHRPTVKSQIQGIKNADFEREAPFTLRQSIQKELLQLPLLPTTTIGSFPQTTDVRQLRANYKKGLISDEVYTQK